MPSIANVIGLTLLVAGPAGLTAQRPPAAFPSQPPQQGGLSPPILPLGSPGDAQMAVAPSPARHDSSLKLPPAGRTKARKGNRVGGLPSVVTVTGSLAVVLGIFLLVAWAMRRAAPPGLTSLPGEVFEVLGRARMTSCQQVHLLRCGKKLILVSVTPAGAETLTEITDPAEVDRLAGLCQQTRPNSATAAFREVFGQFAPRRPWSRSLRALPGENDHDEVRLPGSDMPAAHHVLENRDV